MKDGVFMEFSEAKEDLSDNKTIILLGNKPKGSKVGLEAATLEVLGNNVEKVVEDKMIDVFNDIWVVYLSKQVDFV